MAFRFSPRTSRLNHLSNLQVLRTPSLHRSFHASTVNMTVKTFFDVAWTGPTVQVDSNGKETIVDKSPKGTFGLPLSTPHLLVAGSMPSIRGL
jgi:hypothetical protein